VDDTLNILHCVAVTVTVTLAAVDKGRGTRPVERDKALIRVPRVYHVVEIFIWGVNFKVSQFSVPISFQFADFAVGEGFVFIARNKFPRLRFAFLSQEENKFDTRSRRKIECCVQRAARVQVVVESPVKFALLYGNRIPVIVVIAQKRGTVAAVAGDTGPGKTEEARLNPALVDGVQAVFVNGLQYKFILEISAGNKLSVLKVYLILLIETFAG